MFDEKEKKECAQCQKRVLALTLEVQDLRDHLGIGYDFKRDHGQEGREKLMMKKRLG